jgi:hypothetical protein
MAKFLTAEELLGGGAPVEGKAKAPAGPGWVSAGELLGSPPEERTFLGDVKGFLTDKDSWKAMGKTVAGTVAQASDLGTSVVGGLLSMAPYAAVNTQALLKGESPKIAAQAAMEAGNQVLPQELQTPWAKVAEALGPDAQHAYENNPIA